MLLLKVLHLRKPPILGKENICPSSNLDVKSAVLSPSFHIRAAGSDSGICVEDKVGIY